MLAQSPSDYKHLNIRPEPATSSWDRSAAFNAIGGTKVPIILMSKGEWNRCSDLRCHGLPVVLQQMGKSEVNSRVIGDMVIAGLKELDHVANIQDVMRDQLEEFLCAKRAESLSPKTIENYKYTAGSFVDWLGDRELTQALVYEYFDQMPYDNPETRNTHARGIRAFLRFLRVDYKVPMSKVKERELLTVTPEMVEQALDGCLTDRDRALILFLFESGCRRGEVAGLKCKHIEFNTGLITVPDGKTGYRRAMIGPKAIKALQVYRNGHEPEDSLFGLKGDSIRQALERVGRRAGIKLNAHGFRRGFATEAVGNEMDIVILQTLMGHKDIKTTRRYVTVRDETLIEQYGKHGPTAI